jgi:hypothetical protein
MMTKPRKNHSLEYVALPIGGYLIRCQYCGVDLGGSLEKDEEWLKTVPVDQLSQCPNAPTSPQA